MKAPCCLLAGPCAHCRESCDGAEASRLSALLHSEAEQRGKLTPGLQCCC